MSRATTPVLGAVLLVGVTVLLGAGVTVVATGFTPATTAELVALEASADAVTGRITLEHRAGPLIDVQSINVRVTIDGEPLAHQPPVPFFAATGFHGGPTGPFNPAAKSAWTVGETVSFRIASTNDPPLKPGSAVTVSVTRNNQLIARVTTTAL